MLAVERVLISATSGALLAGSSKAVTNGASCGAAGRRDRAVRERDRGQPEFGATLDHSPSELQVKLREAMLFEGHFPCRAAATHEHGFGLLRLLDRQRIKRYSHLYHVRFGISDGNEG